jgi:hypothetical protein
MKEPIDYLRVSYSSLNLFESCNRKFEFTKLYPRRARNFDNFAADVGTALHKGYQDYLATGDADSALWQLLLAYPHELSWQQENDFRSLEAAVNTLDAMIQSRVPDGWEVATIRRPLTQVELQANEDFKNDVKNLGLVSPYDPRGVEVPAIEVPFELRIKGITLPDGRGIAFTGFIDVIERDIAGSQFRCKDIKTHRAYPSPEYAWKEQLGQAKYKYNAQQVPYGIVLEHILGKEVERFDVTYLDVFVDVASPEVKEYTYEKRAEDIQEWLMNTVMAAQRIQTGMEMDYFPRTSGGCLSWQKPCFYMKPCESRNRKAIEQWFLEGEEPEHPEVTEPWILGVIDIYPHVEGVN